MAKTDLPIYLCTSADWYQVIKTAKSPEEAALAAMQQQMDAESDSFAVATAIKVVPIVILEEQSKLFYAPSILADLGMHKYASQLIEQIKKDSKNDRKG